MLDIVQSKQGFPLLALRAQLQSVRIYNPASVPEDEFTYVDLSAVDQAAKVISGPRQVLGGEAPSRARQGIHNGDVLVSTVRPNLNGVALVPLELDGAIASTGFCVLRPDRDKLDPSYLFHWVRSQSFIDAMVRKATGASYPAVSDNIVRNSLIPLPCLSEQCRIAAILNDADALRAKRRAALTQLNEMAHAIYVNMFGDPILNKNLLPVALLGDICDVRDGTHDSPKYVSVGGYPLVTSRNVTKGYVDLVDAKFISEEDYTKINRRSKVDQGDIILPMIGTIGSPVLVVHEPHYAIKNVALVKFKKGSPYARYVYHLLNGRYFDFIISQKHRGGTQKFVSLGDLRSFPLPLPPKDQQIKFDRAIQALDELKITKQKALDKLNALFVSLQHRAFCGEL